MISPVLSNNWTHRVIFNPDAPRRHVESFFVKANDTKHDRALWLRLTLFCDGKESYGEAWAVWSDKGEQRRIVAKERFPIGRVLFDPERPGVGIGPCSIQDGQTYGVIQGDDVSIAWDLRLEAELPPYQPLPSERLYRGTLLTNKLVSPKPSALLSGKIELWEKKSRHADKEVVRIDNWRGMQGHNWGSEQPQEYAWTHCNSFNEAPEGAFFEAVAARPKLAFLRPNVVLGRLVLGGKTYRFDTWKAFTGQQSQRSPLGFKFEMSGPDGKLVGEVTGQKEDTVGLTYKNPAGPDVTVLNTKLARLSLTLTPNEGGSRTLTSTKAALELAGNAVEAGVTVVA